MEQLPRLTFKALNERIDEIPEHPSVSTAFSARERYGYATALFALALFFLAMKVLPDDKLYTLIVACFFLLIEIIAFVIALFPKWPPRLPNSKADRMEYADQLDHDLGHYGTLITWITRFPREQIAEMADYAEMRQERFRERQPLLLGGVEKLGALPVLIAIATQFRGMHWPPDISWPEIIAYLIVAWLYWLCVISIGTRLRGRLMEIALKRALTIKDKIAADAAGSDAAESSGLALVDV